MIVRKRRKHETLFGRIFAKTPRQTMDAGLLSDAQFHQELLKEMYRSDRRPKNRDFGLIRMIFEDQMLCEDEFLSPLVEKFNQRLRITDSIGWYDSSLSFLLPETDKEGTLQTANVLAKIASDHGAKVDTEISIYPWDDGLVAISKELRQLLEDQSNDHSESNDDRPNGNGSLDNGSGTNGNGSNGSGSNGSGSNGSGASDNEAASVQALKFKASKLVTEKSYAFVKSAPIPWWKRTVDILGSGFGLLALSPVLIGAAVAIKLSSKGPVFFRQVREGKNGKPFGILKFRTMVLGAEEKQADLRSRNEQDGPAFKIKNDPRITGVGRYLRKSCVDELPQLFNVLIGQMSLVGPRPLPVHESHACDAWQRTRLTVLPGLTCTWQAHGGRNVKFADWMRMDLDYIEKQSFWFDLKLIFETAFIAILHKGSV